MSIPRYSRVYSGAIVGAEARVIRIETTVADGLPRHSVVGLPGSAVRECLDRIWSAMRTCGMPLPRGVITINLAPADVQKHGTGFDLAIATGLLAASGDTVDATLLETTAFAGELALDGSIRSVRGILPVALGARRARLSQVVVPEDNAGEAGHVPGITVCPVRSLSEVRDMLMGEALPSRSVSPQPARRTARRADFSDVVGQEAAIEALVTAAAGGHNVLLIGPPGCGKSMLAERFPGILPPWTPDLEFTCNCMHSVRGQLPREGWLHERPFRAPHHTVSRAGMLGGGRPLIPGEISLAHGGVLYLDEMPEFDRTVLESLREPLDSGRIVLSRLSGSVTYQADFQLLASMNPCPCGYAGSDEKTCGCPPTVRQRYRGRVSGPLLDRIDMHLHVHSVPYDRMMGAGGLSTAALRRRVERAVTFRQRRGQREANASTPVAGILTHVTEEGLTMLTRMLRASRLSMRSRDRILRMARTLADLDGQESVDDATISRAIQYRVLEREQDVS